MYHDMVIRTLYQYIVASLLSSEYQAKTPVLCCKINLAEYAVQGAVSSWLVIA